MITLVMSEGRASVKRDGDVRGQIEFVGEPENGEYVFIPRDGTIIFRSEELIDIGRQVAALSGETSQPVETKSSGAETPTKEPCPRCGEQDYLLNLCGKCVQALVRNADTFKTEATAEQTKPPATDLDSVAERILAQFKNEGETLTDATLLAASGLDREAYLDVRDFLLIETEEISETAENTAPTEYVRNFPRKVEAAA